MKQRSRVKRSIPPKKTCNNYSAKEPIQDSSDTSRYHHDDSSVKLLNNTTIENNDFS